MNHLIGNKLLTKNNVLVDTNLLLENKKYVGLYFSAKLCKYCKEFNPFLFKACEKISDDCEFIYISSDNNQEEFDEYFQTLPFSAVPFQSRSIKHELIQLFDIKTVPNLVFISKNTKLINTNGRYLVQDNIDILTSEMVVNNLHYNDLY